GGREAGRGGGEGGVQAEAGRPHQPAADGRPPRWPAWPSPDSGRTQTSPPGRARPGGTQVNPRANDLCGFQAPNQDSAVNTDSIGRTPGNGRTPLSDSDRAPAMRDLPL